MCYIVILLCKFSFFYMKFILNNKTFCYIRAQAINLVNLYTSTNFNNTQKNIFYSRFFSKTNERCFSKSISLVARPVYIQLIEGEYASRFPWLNPQFYTDTLQALLNRSYPSLEWALTSPPKPHAFVSLPLQSRIFIRGNKIFRGV